MVSETLPGGTRARLPAAYSERLGLLISRCAAELFEMAERDLARLGLNERRYVALALLASDEPSSQHELGKLMGLAPQLVVALTDSLEDLGLVTRRTNPADRRRTVVELTNEGSNVLARADELSAHSEETLFVTLGEDGRAELRETLRRAFLPDEGAEQ